MARTVSRTVKGARRDNAVVAREHGGILVSSAVVLTGLLMLFGLAYDGFRVYRENINQDRLARSIGMVTLKAYRRAGCEFDRDNKNVERIKFALRAASHVVDVEGATEAEIKPPVLTADGSFGPIEAVFEDPQEGRSQAKATVRLGSVTGPKDTTLDNLNPCTPASEPSLNLSPFAKDDWEAGRAFQAGLIPSDFNWKVYLSSNPDLYLNNPPLDTEIEAKRHFALNGLNEGLNQGLVSRTKYSLPLEDVNRFIAAEVTVSGLSSTSRAASFAKLFGVTVLERSSSKVLVVEGSQLPVGAQPLQVGEINISANPPAFNQPSGIVPNSVSYTMSMDLKIESFPRDWVNVFNTGINDIGGPQTRRPALFLSGLRQVAENYVWHPSANAVHIVHGSSDDGLDMIGRPLNGTFQENSHDNRLVTTRFAANPGQYFNVTWTVDGSTLKTFINGFPTPRGTVNGKFTWGQNAWQWNAYRSQFPWRAENSDGPVKVKNVYWWNRPLSNDEVYSLPSARLYSTQNRVTLFNNCGFGVEAGGWQKVLTPGRYPSMAEFGVADNNLSSLRIPTGTRVTLYADPDFKGESRTLTADTECLDGSVNFDDKASSLIIESTSPNQSMTGESPRRFHFVELAS